MMLFNDNIEVDVHFDSKIGMFRIRDSYGEFTPISVPFWKHYIEKPYRIMHRENGTTMERVLEIFMSDFAYLYCCKN